MHVNCLIVSIGEESVLGLLDRTVDTDDHRMVPLVRLQSDLLLRLQLLCLHLLDLTCKHLLWFSCGVDAVCLCVWCVCVLCVCGVCVSAKGASLDGVDSHYSLCIKGPPRVTVFLLVITVNSLCKNLLIFTELYT